MASLLFTADILLFAIMILALVFASVTDIRKREAPNWLTLSLIPVGLFIRLVASMLSAQYSYILSAFIALAIFFILGLVFFYTRLFGGGDSKMLLSIAIFFSTTPSFSSYVSFISEPFLLSFLMNMFLIGSVYGIFFLVYYYAKFKKKIEKEIKNVKKKVNKPFIYLFSVAVILSFIVLALVSKIYAFFIFALIFLFIPRLYFLIKTVEDSMMIKMLGSRELNEGDVLIYDVKIGARTIKAKKALDPEDVKLLQKIKKKVAVQYGLPFIPVFLFALLTTLFFGNIIINVLFSLFF